MRVYGFAVQEGYEWVVPKNDADFEVFRGFDGTRRRRGWTPILVKLIRLDDQGKIRAESDFPWLGEHAPVMTRRASELLQDVLAGDGELLPLACDDADLRVLNVLRVIDALDVARSDVVRFPSTGRIMTVKAHVFRPNGLRGVKVFKVPELLRGTTFVTDEIVDLVDRSDLKGVGFRLLWDEIDGPARHIDRSRAVIDD